MLSANMHNAIVTFLVRCGSHARRYSDQQTSGDSDQILCLRSATDCTVCGSLRLASYSLEWALADLLSYCDEHSLRFQMFLYLMSSQRMTKYDLTTAHG